jgi:hypothetical protein
VFLNAGTLHPKRAVAPELNTLELTTPIAGTGIVKGGEPHSSVFIHNNSSFFCATLRWAHEKKHFMLINAFLRMAMSE